LCKKEFRQNLVLVGFIMFIGMFFVISRNSSVQAAPSFELVGFATLNGGTTGGTGGKEVTATSISQINELLSKGKRIKTHHLL